MNGAGPLQKTGAGPMRQRKAAACKNSPPKSRTRKAKNGPTPGTAQKTAKPADTARTGVNGEKRHIQDWAWDRWRHANR